MSGSSTRYAAYRYWSSHRNATRVSSGVGLPSWIMPNGSDHRARFHTGSSSRPSTVIGSVVLRHSQVATGGRPDRSTSRTLAQRPNRVRGGGPISTGPSWEMSLKLISTASGFSCLSKLVAPRDRRTGFAAARRATKSSSHHQSPSTDRCRTSIQGTRDTRSPRAGRCRCPRA